MMKFFIVLLTLLITGGCASAAVADEDIDGGTTDYSNKKAPKIIKSENIVRFKLITEDDSIEYPAPSGRYVMEIVPAEKGFNMSLTCGEIKKSRIVGSKVMKQLQAVIKKYNVASINGHSKFNTALGNYLSLDIVYDSGETIHADAEGGCDVVPDNWNQMWFIEFFFDKLGIKYDEE